MVRIMDSKTVRGEGGARRSRWDSVVLRIVDYD